MMTLVLLDSKHCNKLRIVENTESTRKLIKIFTGMCGVDMSDGYIDFLFLTSEKAVFTFGDHTGTLLEIRRQPGFISSF